MRVSGVGRWQLATVALVALAAAACGTTVPNAQTAAPGAAGALDAGLGSGLGDPAPVGSLPPAEVGTPGTAGPSSSGQAPRGSATAGSTPAGPSQPRATAAAGGPTGVGVTASTITIGALTANGAGQFQRALGFDKGATGDQIAMTRAVVSWLNKRGGLGGRKINLVVYDVDPTGDRNTVFQAACTAFTQDNKVFAVASILSHLPSNFYQCLHNAGVVVVAANPALSAGFFQRYAGTVYAPSNPSYTRVLADSVEALWADGWLTASSKVGVVGFDTPDARGTVKDGLIPALQRRGLTLAESFYTAEDTSAAAAYSGGVLRFKSSGVDRVFFAPGGQPIYFALAAEQQVYHPRYEMSTLEYPGPVAATLPASAMRGAAGIGWSPYLDLDNASAAKVPTPAKAACVDAVREAEQNLSTGTTLAIATWICDDWFFLRDVLAKTSPINRAQFASSVASLDRSFRAASTFATYFAPGRTGDGAAGYRLNKFSEACRCFQYASAIRPLP